MRVRPGKDWVAIAVMGGFAEVDNNEVTVLVNAAERGDRIDREKARSAFTEAETRLNQIQQSGSGQEEFKLPKLSNGLELDFRLLAVMFSSKQLSSLQLSRCEQVLL